MRDKYLYYIDCPNACRADPDDANHVGDSVICPECGFNGVIYDLREEKEEETDAA